MTFLLLVLAVVGGALFLDLKGRVGRLERRVADLLDELAASNPQPLAAEPEAPSPMPVARAYRGPARVTVSEQPPPVPEVEPAASTSEAETSPPPEPPAPEPPPEPPRDLATTIEGAIGGRLPIWIGGVALVLAGFFLVRYSIEQGLLGPEVRSIIAAVFGVALLAASEGFRLWPRIAEDPRVGQALAGAGIASLYGTLYMASELYGLIGPLVAFILLVIVTVAALVLALRHGPPTAIMGLTGGFAAPYVAGLAADSLVPVLVYLGLLMAGLFALAIHRGWLWLALAATGGGLVWSLGIMLAGLTGADPSLGIFIAIAAVAATLVVPRTGTEDARIRLIPMVAGFAQLAIFAPLIDFAATGWILYGLLSAASLWLAWRDPRLFHGSLVALGLVLILLGGGFSRGSALAPWAAIGATLLFGVPGHVEARRADTGRWWTALALVGGAGPLLVAWSTASGLLHSHAWGGLMTLAAIPPAVLSWRAGTEGRTTGMPDWSLAGGAVVSAILVFLAAGLWFEPIWLATAGLAIGCGLAAWARSTTDRFLGFASLGALLVAALCLVGGLELHPELLEAIFWRGDRPAVAVIAALALLPAVLVAFAAWLHRDGPASEPLRWNALALALAVPLAIVPALWHPAVLAAAVLGLALTRSAAILPRYGLEGAAVATGIALLAPLLPFAGIALMSLAGETAHFGEVPALDQVGLGLALPATLVGVALWFSSDRFARRALPALGAAVGIGAVATLYALAKQPLAIADDDAFLASGFLERTLITQALCVVGWSIVRFGGKWRRWGMAALALALFRFVSFDLLLLNPVLVRQHVGAWPLANIAVAHALLAAFWLFWASRLDLLERLAKPLRYGALGALFIAVAIGVRQVFQGAFLDAPEIPRGENYAYSVAFLVMALGWLWLGIARGQTWLRLAGFALLTLVTVKVFLVDASALEGLLRVLSFLGLGAALIGIGWAYGRLLRAAKANQLAADA